MLQIERAADPRARGAPRCAAARGSAASAALVGFRRTSCRGSRTCPSSSLTKRARERSRPPRAPRAPTDSADAASRRRRRAATRSPPSASRASDQRQRDQHDVEPHEPVLELRDHRRRRVAGGALPDPALHGGDEVDDPGADRDAERQDRGGGRMLGERRRRRRERDVNPALSTWPSRTVTSSGG